LKKALRIWLVTTGEPLPVDGQDERLLRTGLLARMLAQRGHQVVWWSAVFNHSRKRHRYESDRDWRSPEGYELRMLWSPGYARAVSLRRIVDHRFIGRAFERRVRSSPERADIIVCSWPLLELATASVRLGKEWNIPVVLDARDLWPDIFLDVVPRPLRPLARLLLAPMFTGARKAFENATAVTGVNENFVDWAMARGGGRPARLPAFPLGYPRTVEDGQANAEGIEFWSARGVGTDPGTTVVCFFGVFGRTLDLDTVIEAARGLADAGVQLVLCGVGERFEELQRRTGDLPHVIVPGWVDGGKIRALMRLSAAGLAPYRNTPDFQSSIPNKAGEYLAGGLPVITCLEGALSKLLRARHCGVVYKEGDAQSLVASIRGLAADVQGRIEQSRNAREVFDALFEAGKVYGAYADCIEQLCQAQQAGR
jgi:glycosyltransferase involved in cell wall biosynthesis